MTSHLIFTVLVGSLLVIRQGALPTASAQTTQTLSDVARVLDARGTVLRVLVAGRVKTKWSKGAPTFDVPNGPTTAVLLQLPDYRAPYLITIASSRRGMGRTTEIFVPSGAVFDADFQQVGEFGEEQLDGRVESLVAELRIDQALSKGRYLLLYTRGDLLKGQVGFRGQDAVDDAIASFLQRGLMRVERSLDASIQVDTKLLPGYARVQTRTPSDIVRDLVEQGATVTVPAAGKVTHTIGKDAPTFTLGGGPSSVAVLRLPDYQTPYIMKLESLTLRSGIFIPSGLFFDEEFQQVDEFNEERLSGKSNVAVELAFRENTRDARYLLLFTRGDRAGMTVQQGRAALFVGGAYTMPRSWAARSLEAKLEIETRSALGR